MGRPAKGRARTRSERKARLARTESSDEGPGLVYALESLTRKLPPSQAKALMEAAGRPGQSHLGVLSGLLIARAIRETEIMRRLEIETDRRLRGSDKYDADRLEGIVQYLQEQRRYTRSIRGILATISRAARVSSQIDLGKLPDALRIVVEALWADTEPAGELPAHEADLIDGE